MSVLITTVQNARRIIGLVTKHNAWRRVNFWTTSNPRRAINLLQKDFFTYQELAFDRFIGNPQVANNILVAEEGSDDEIYARGRLAGLPFKLL